MSCNEILNLTPQYVMAITAIWAGVVAIKQLKLLVESARTESRMAEIQANTAILQRDQIVLQHQQGISTAVLNISEAAVHLSSIASNQLIDTNALKAAELRSDAAISIYLSALDTLCGTFLRDSELYERYKLDYRSEILDSVKRYESKFGVVDKKYRNIQTVYERLQTT